MMYGGYDGGGYGGGGYGGGGGGGGWQQQQQQWQQPQQQSWSRPQGPAGTDKPYLERELRANDAQTFSGAALVPYRKVDGNTELLMAWERPWNSFINGFDVESWNPLGGKRINWQEFSAGVTGIRCFLEALDIDGVKVPGADELNGLMSKAFTVWYPTGKYACIFVEVADDMMKDIPEKFAEAKTAAGSQEEFKINAQGVKKWLKMIDGLEWVPASELVPDAKKECSDLLGNLLKVDAVREFLEGKLDPAELPEAAPKKPKGKGGKDKKGGKDSGKGWGKDSKGKGGKKGSGGGMPMYGAPMQMGGGYGMGMPMQMQPMQMQKGGGKGMDMYGGQAQQMQQAQGGPADPDLQLQLYGEQLYMLVQPLVPNHYVAQKITGMLLELPSDELIMNLTNREELQRRVGEAVNLLQEDGEI